MNTKIIKIMSVLATVAIVASSFVWALPVAAANPGDGTFAKQDMPADLTAGKYVLLPGSNIIDIAVGSDGNTIYVAEPAAANYIMKSTDGGQSFDTVTNNYGAAGVTPAGGGVPIAMSIAPDDVNTVAVTDGVKVIITKDGGTTWSALPNPTLAVGNVVTDIAVAPARSGTLLGREYVISIADGGATVTGDVQIIGGNAIWATVGGVLPANTITGLFDFTSVVVTPNFLGDRCVVAIGTNAVAGSTSLFIVNTATNTIVNNPAGAIVATGVPLATGVTAITTNFLTVPALTSIVTSSIALPTNFDPTTTSGRRAYAAIASAAAPFSDNDVYRVESDTAKALGAVIAPVYSIAYAGTIDTGTLFMGPRSNADVKYSTTMTASSPTWTTTLNGPSVGAAVIAPSVVLKVASDFATSNKIYAGTLGIESGFNVSKDAGVSFIQESLIDTGAGKIGNPSFSFASDGKSAKVSAKDTNGYIAIWQTDVPFTATGWSRIFSKLSAGTGSMKISGSAIYFAEVGVANGNIYVSQDAGVSFSTRNGPSGLTMLGYEIRDAQTVYYVDTTGGLSKSTNGAFFFGTPVATGMGPNTGINLSKANQIIASGTGVTISNDDGATFTSMSGLTGGTSFAVTTDGAYATNNIIYVTDTGVAGANIYRVKTDSVSNTFENMGFPQGGGVTIRGIGIRSGVMYVTTNNIATGIIRTLTPTDLVGNQNWQYLFNGLPGAPQSSASRTGSVNLYVRVPGLVGTNDVYAYNDFLATTKPTLTTPADNYSDDVNPSGGNGYAIDLKMQAMGVGNAQVDRVDIEIVDKNNGFTGTPFNALPLVVAPTNPIINTGQIGFILQPNHVYQWRFRAARQTSGQLIDSPWSDARTINVQAGSIVSQQYVGPVLLGPQGGAQGLDPNSVGFAWAPVSGATEYQIIVSTDPQLTKTVAGTPATSTIPAFQATGLSYSTVYYWAVKATKPTTSVQTVGTFTTMAKPVAQPTGTAVATQPPITVITNPTAETPAYIWAVIAIGAILVVAVMTAQM